MKIIKLSILFLVLGLSILSTNIKSQTSENLPSNTKPITGSQDCSKLEGNESKDCYDINKLKNICASVTENVEDIEGEFNYRWERELREAAGVNKDDDETTTTLKITKMLKVLGNKLECDSGLSFGGAGILKVAVANKSGVFLLYMIKKYKIDVNRVDKADNSTVLDFVEDQLQANKNYPTIMSNLRDYKKLILDAGGTYNKYKDKQK